MTAPDWLADAIFYQIFPERFADGDRSLDPLDTVPWDSEPTPENFFGGDLQGIIDHLDHIQDLGANALYLTPIFEAQTNHRYDTVDYFSVDHRLGDLGTFRRLLSECHERGMRVVLDAVLNHCGDGHPAFQDVVAREAESPYVNWFSVEGFPVVAAPEPNYRTCSGCHYLPKWNVYNPEVRAHHFDVARYWIDQGIDGWRLDVPYFINRTFWRQFRDVVKSRNEQLYIVAEEWHEPEQWLQGDTADGTMNYTLRDLVLGFTADRTLDAADFAAGMNDLSARIPHGFHPGMLNLLSSHDTERVLTRHGGDADATLLAYALMYAAEGVPMVYYGDEVGMTGENDPGCRAGMVWDRARWNAALFEGLRDLARLRSGSPTLRRGTQWVTALDPDTALVIRTLGGASTAIIVHRGAGVVLRPDTHDLPEGVGELVLGPRQHLVIECA
ncbi:glycoside hydrolase family 13 protein [Microbacterium protaetiae]|uniref:Glycoside hydrolase family 13 protein n=1 Tax=Microbacterium protaetiae TaxID=2509458 RepID=A0A4P6EBW0_9MICO|nr:glycoside hydrolase family 13 protein [Microbacterium protaetiae]QAY59086.1 glycoside hydrolase family 13 protein [Microbacterium protaetiae]